MESFYNSFCKVESLCFKSHITGDYEPNWLGWTLILVLVLGIIYFTLELINNDK